MYYIKCKIMITDFKWYEITINYINLNLIVLNTLIWRKVCTLNRVHALKRSTAQFRKVEGSPLVKEVSSPTLLPPFHYYKGQKLQWFWLVYRLKYTPLVFYSFCFLFWSYIFHKEYKLLDSNSIQFCWWQKEKSQFYSIT